MNENMREKLSGYDINYQWGNGPRRVENKYHLAATMRDVTGIGCEYPIIYDSDGLSGIGFAIEKYKDGYSWKWLHADGSIDLQSTYSDYYTAVVRLMEFVGLNDDEINDIMWGGKSRKDVSCGECCMNKAEKEGFLSDFMNS